MNNNLQEELQILKNKDFENDQENNNLKLNCQILEKKIKGMQTELDLKNIQIQNQEEIISRRNDNNNSNILENDSAISSLRPIFKILSIIPGMEIGAPLLTDTNNGLSLFPNNFPVFSSNILI